METALFKQWYLNQWLVDDEAKVYKYNPEINRASYLPRGLDDWHYVLGVDLAHSPDSTAFVVSAYHPFDPKLYIVYARKHLKMDITAASEEIIRLAREYKFEVRVVDGANKMAVEEMNNRHGCGLIPADKTGKVDFIRIMNDEFVQKKIVLLPEAYTKHEPNVDSLEDQYQTLVWITDNGKVKEPRKEHPSIHNDLADASLYNWRYCYSYLFKAPEKGPAWESQERWEGDHIKKLVEQVRKEKNPNELDLHFDENLFDFSQDEVI
jgi:sulfur relay (sulfurtransferase) DsrC/TusE family protein